MTNPRNAGVAVGRDAEEREVEGVHHDEVAVRAVPGRWSGTGEAGRAGIVGQLDSALDGDLPDLGCRDEHGEILAIQPASRRKAGMNHQRTHRRPRPRH